MTMGHWHVDLGAVLMIKSFYVASILVRGLTLETHSWTNSRISALGSAWLKLLPIFKFSLESLNCYVESSSSSFLGFNEALDPTLGSTYRVCMSSISLSYLIIPCLIVAKISTKIFRVHKLWTNKVSLIIPFVSDS
jgi:hypothetical protein